MEKRGVLRLATIFFGLFFFVAMQYPYEQIRRNFSFLFSRKRPFNQANTAVDSPVDEPSSKIVKKGGGSDEETVKEIIENMKSLQLARAELRAIQKTLQIHC